MTPTPFVFILVAILMSGCSEISDYSCRKIFGASCFEVFPTKKEKLIIEKIKSNKAKGLYFVDINELFGNDINKICLQRPYEMKESFEGKSKMTVREYEVLADEHRNNLWLFYKNGHKEVLSISNGLVYDFYESEDAHQKIQCINKTQFIFFQ